MALSQLSVYRGCTPVVDRFADAEESLSVTIVQALADAADVDPTDLPPIYDYINPDAIDSLHLDTREGAPTELSLSFTVDNWNVFVSDDGQVRICDGTQPTSEPEPVFA